MFGEYHKAFRLCDLVDVTKLTDALGNAKDMLQHVETSVKNLKYDKAPPEYKVVEDLDQFLLLPLCESVTLEQNLHDAEKLRNKGLDVFPIGIGTKKTWHPWVPRLSSLSISTQYHLTGDGGG